MGVVRTMFRKLLDHELGVLGDELTQLEHKIDQQAVQLESFRKRYELAQARIGMRVKRSRDRDEDEPRGLALSREEEDMVKRLRSGEFPEFEQGPRW